MRCPYCHCESPVSPATFAFPISIEPGDRAFSASNESVEVDQGYCLRCRGHVVVVRRFYDGEEIDAEIVYPSLRGESSIPETPIPEGYLRKLAEAEELIQANPEASGAISRWIIRRMRRRVASATLEDRFEPGESYEDPAPEAIMSSSPVGNREEDGTLDAATLARNARIALEEAFCAEAARNP